MSSELRVECEVWKFDQTVALPAPARQNRSQWPKADMVQLVERMKKVEKSKSSKNVPVEGWE